MYNKHLNANEKSKETLIELVYSIIRESQNGRITAKQLEKQIGDKNKVHYALKYLLREHRVKKVRGLGIDRISYFYQVMDMSSH